MDVPPPGLPPRRDRLLKLAVYNPCHASTSARLSEISYHLRNIDIIGLVGTGSRAAGYYKAPDFGLPTIVHTLEHVELRWGWARSPHCNRSCGGSLLFRRARFSSRLSFKRFLPVPSELAGRLGIAELSGVDRLAPGFMYVPHRPLDRKLFVQYDRTVRALFTALTKAFGTLNSGVKPILFVDLNDGLGVPASNDEALDTRYIGTVAPEQEHLAGTLMRTFCAQFGMTPVNTHFNAGNTFWVPKGPPENGLTLSSSPGHDVGLLVGARVEHRG